MGAATRTALFSTVGDGLIRFANEVRSTPPGPFAPLVDSASAEPARVRPPLETPDGAALGGHVAGPRAGGHTLYSTLRKLLESQAVPGGRLTIMTIGYSAGDEASCRAVQAAEPIGR